MGFDLAFAISPTLGAQLSLSLLRLVNQRKGLRVEPGVTVPVKVQIPDQIFRTTGRMRDMSANGMAIVIDAALERALSRVTEARVLHTSGPRPSLDASRLNSQSLSTR